MHIHISSRKEKDCPSMPLWGKYYLLMSSVVLDEITLPLSRRFFISVAEQNLTFLFMRLSHCLWVLKDQLTQIKSQVISAGLALCSCVARTKVANQSVLCFDVQCITVRSVWSWNLMHAEVPCYKAGWLKPQAVFEWNGQIANKGKGLVLLLFIHPVDLTTRLHRGDALHIALGYWGCGHPTTTCMCC